MEADFLKSLLAEIPGIAQNEIPGFARIIKKIPIGKLHDELHKAWEEKCRQFKVSSNSLYSDVLMSIKNSKHCLFSSASQQAQKKIFNPLEELDISVRLFNALRKLGYFNLCAILNDTNKWESGNDMKELIREDIGEKSFLELEEIFEKLEIKKLQKV